MAISDFIREVRWRAAGHFQPLGEPFSKIFSGLRVLEVGGPSALFASEGLIPIYPHAELVDNSQFAEVTVWHEGIASKVFAPEGRPIGTQFVSDDPELRELPDATWDAVCSSHVIEHLANPLRSLETWQRLATPGGYLLIVAPHHEGTFDRNRPVTTLEHLIADRRMGTSEQDLSHLSEVLDRHDFSRDSEIYSERWEEQRRDNANTRMLHHHVFNTRSLLELLTYSGIEIVGHETRFPHDIYVLGRFPTEAKDSQRGRIPTVKSGPFSS